MSKNDIKFQIFTSVEEARAYGKFCYIISKKGLFIYNKDAISEVIVPAKSAPFGEEVTEMCLYAGPKIPFAELWRAFIFFQAVYDEHKSEAHLQIWYDPDVFTKTGNVVCKFVCPEQEVDGASVDWVLEDSLIKEDGAENMVPLAEIHSHGSMAAFQSGTDRHSEEEFSKCGIAITLGNCDKAFPSAHARLMVLGTTFEAPMSLVVDFGCNDWEFPVKWMKRISKSRFSYNGYVGGGVGAGIVVHNKPGKNRDKGGRSRTDYEGLWRGYNPDGDFDRELDTNIKGFKRGGRH